MALTADGLKSAIKAQLTPILGAPHTETYLNALCSAIVNEIKTGTAVTGSATANTISNINGSPMAADVVATLVLESTPILLLGFCTGIAQHITIEGSVTYTDFPDYELSGTIVGLSAAALANRIKTQFGEDAVTATLTAFCTALITYIMTNATVSNGSIS